MIYLHTCEICGTLNLKENNYCTHCGNKFISEHICPHCGEVNLDYATHCKKCGNQINPIEINDFDILFNEYNESLLLNAEISDSVYMSLLSNIFIRANYSEIYGNSIRDKILNFASVFTECMPKSRGYERGYIYFGNCIFYDDRLDDSVQIATIIHELGHYFLFNIIESLLCHVFNVKPSTTLQSFIWFFLTRPEFKIMNEYCAHTVEGRFIPYGYQSYGSFNYLVDHSQMSEEEINLMVAFGNSFANEIIVYLEDYLDEDVRQQIKVQYKKDMKPPSYKSIIKETNESFPPTLKNKLLLELLYDVFKEASQENNLDELKEIKEGIEVI